jgi:hypothetical protein
MSPSASRMSLGDLGGVDLTLHCLRRIDGFFVTHRDAGTSRQDARPALHRRGRRVVVVFVGRFRWRRLSGLPGGRGRGGWGGSRSLAVIYAADVLHRYGAAPAAIQIDCDLRRRGRGHSAAGPRPVAQDDGGVRQIGCRTGRGLLFGT